MNETNYSIDEILNAINEINNFNKKKILKVKKKDISLKNLEIPKSTLKINQHAKNGLDPRVLLLPRIFGNLQDPSFPARLF